MKAISIGEKFQVYGDSLRAYDSIPANTYNVRFLSESPLKAGC